MVSICVRFFANELRFRKACQVQGVTDLPYTSWLQPWGSYVGIVAFTILALVNGFDVFFPGRFSAASFLTAYVGIPTFLFIYFGHRIYKKQDRWAYRPEDVDLMTGIDAVLAAETPEGDKKGWRETLMDVITLK